MSCSCDSPLRQQNQWRISNEPAFRGYRLHARIRPFDGRVRSFAADLARAPRRRRPTAEDDRGAHPAPPRRLRARRLSALPRADGRARTTHPTRGARFRIRRGGHADLGVRVLGERGLPEALLHLGVPDDDRAVGDRRRDRVVPLSMKNRLRVLRAERDWSQGELADRLEVSRQTVNALENDKYDPSLPLAFRIASLFGMRIEDVFTPE